MRLLVLSVVAVAAFGASRMQWRSTEDGQMELREGGRTVLVYNPQPQLKPGAPEDRRRCCYVYPLYTPAGVSMLDDFPKDHWHHRGLFWAWPQVETRGQRYDGWMMHGMTVRSERAAAMPGSPLGSFTAVNSWYAGETKIVSETVSLTAYPAKKNSRDIDLTLTLEAVGALVTLRGSHEEGKSYGGVSARFAPRENTVIRADSAQITKDQDLVRHYWAELEGTYSGKRVVLRITPNPANPGAPFQWCLRDYGFVGASFPGKTPEQNEYTLEPGKPLVLKFRITVADLL